MSYVVAAAAVAAGMWALWVGTAKTVAVEVDGHRQEIRTHRGDVEGVLFDLGFGISDGDRVTPALDTPAREADSYHVVEGRSVPDFDRRDVSGREELGRYAGGCVV